MLGFARKVSYICTMFIRQVKKQRSKSSKVFYQYTLAQTSRINGKVKQRAILYLGSDKLLEDKNNRQLVLDILKSKIFKQPKLFPQVVAKKLKELATGYYDKYCIKYGQNSENPTSIPPLPAKSEFHNIDIKGLDIEEVKEVGAENICKQVLDKFRLHELFKSLGMTDSQTQKSLISIASRAIYSESEHKTSQILETNSELAACYGYNK